MPVLRRKNSVALAKVETTVGTDAVPTAGSNAFRVENIRIAPRANIVQTDEVTGSLDGNGPIIGGMTHEIAFDLYLKGGGTAGVAPEFDAVMQACRWASVLTASPVPAAPEALAAGASATQCTLGASAVGTAQLYRGMPIIFSSAVAGPAFISDYSAAKLAVLTDTMSGNLTATSNYQIPANVLYKPASSNLKSASIYIYTDGVRWRFVGCRGSMQASFPSGGPPKLSFRMMGLWLDETDQAVPTPTYDGSRPAVFRDASVNSYTRMLVNRLATGLSRLDYDMGNEVVFPDNPNTQEGHDPAEIVRARMTGRMDPYKTLIATRDIMADFRAGTQRIIHARVNAAAGVRCAITMPAAQYTGRDLGDRSGLLTEEVPFECVGQDAGAFICLW